MQYSVINSSHHGVHYYISMTYFITGGLYQNGWRGSEGTNFQLSFDSCLHEIPLKLLTYILYYIEVSFLLTVYSWVILGVVLTISVFYLIIYVIVYLNLGRSFY